jgi:hypothetical protein
VAELTRDEWIAAGAELARSQRDSQWCMGDWWNAGLQWGEGRKVCDHLGIDCAHAMKCGSVCKAFKSLRRRKDLTFGHHQEAAAVADVAKQEELLDWCEAPLRAGEDSPRSTRELRQRVRESKESASAGPCFVGGVPSPPPEPFTYASLCSGIEGASVAWHDFGWMPEWFAEIDPYCCRLLAARYPLVRNLGDIAAIRRGTLDGVHQGQTWTSSLPERRANLSALPAYDKALMMTVGNLLCNSFALRGFAALVGSSGKTLPVPCLPTEDGHLAPCSGGWLNAGMGSPTECWTLKTSESPRLAVASSLSGTLAGIGGGRPRSYLTTYQFARMKARLDEHEKAPPPELVHLFSGATLETKPPSLERG